MKKVLFLGFLTVACTSLSCKRDTPTLSVLKDESTLDESVEEPASEVAQADVNPSEALDERSGTPVEPTAEQSTPKGEVLVVPSEWLFPATDELATDGFGDEYEVENGFLLNTPPTVAEQSIKCAEKFIPDVKGLKTVYTCIKAASEQTGTTTGKCVLGALAKGGIEFAKALKFYDKIVQCGLIGSAAYGAAFNALWDELYGSKPIPSVPLVKISGYRYITGYYWDDDKGPPGRRMKIGFDTSEGTARAKMDVYRVEALSDGRLYETLEKSYGVLKIGKCRWIGWGELDGGWTCYTTNNYITTLFSYESGFAWSRSGGLRITHKTTDTNYWTSASPHEK